MKTQEEAGPICGSGDQPPKTYVAEENSPSKGDTATERESGKTNASENQFDGDLVRWTKVLAVFTGALVFAAGLQFWAMQSQLNVMRGQLEAMNRDQKPYISIDDPGTPTFHEIDQIGSGQALWTWTFNNSGKGMARNLTVRHSIKLGNASFEPSYLTRPVFVGDFHPGVSRLILTASAPVITKSAYDTLAASFLGIRVRIEFDYTDDIGSEFSTVVCMGRSDSGRVAFRSPKDCIE